MISTSPSVFCTRALVLVAIGSAVAHAQTPRRQASSCDGRTISEIRVTALRPPFTGEAAYWRRFARTLGLHHATTDTAVVRRFLALETGGKCSDFRIRESARLLREQPFLASATVSTVPDGAGGVRVMVETTDEISATASVSLGGGRVSYLEIGNENMFGNAWLLALHASDRELEGRSAGFRMSDFQFLGRPYQLDAQADWGQRTSGWLLAASHGYLTDLQKVAWEAGVSHVGQEFIELSRGQDMNDVAQKYQRNAADLGAVFKLGNLRTPILVGGLINYVNAKPRGVVAVTDQGIVSDTSLNAFYPPITRTRLTGVGAWRNLNFIAVRGFEALTATQDVPTGFQLFGQFGHGVPTFGGTDDLWFLADILSGVGSAKTYSELHVINEARRDLVTAIWDGIVSSGRLAFYWAPNELYTFHTWTDFAGGWRVQWPYQLALATDDRRLIGYSNSLYGGRRAGGGAELRRLLPNVNKRVDIGVGTFVNASRLWGGDSPFGVNTPLLPSAGITLYGALPKGSQRLLRIDLGAPLRGGIPHSGWQVRLTYKDANRIFRQEPNDIANAREQLVGPDVFRP